MRNLTKAALVLAHGVMVAQPVFAAELIGDQQTRVGVFGGVRLNLAVGGPALGSRARAGLALAPTVRSERMQGATRTRIGEGLHFGLAERGRPELTFVGTSIDRLGMAPNGRPPKGYRAGVSTLGWVGIGAGVVVAGFVGYGIWLHEAMKCDPSDDCS